MNEQSAYSNQDQSVHQNDWTMHGTQVLGGINERPDRDPGLTE